MHKAQGMREKKNSVVILLVILGVGHFYLSGFHFPIYE